MNTVRPVLALFLLSAILARAEQASPPQGVTLSIYDVGLGVVSENRRVNLANGENEIVLKQVPARLDASTATLSLLSGGRALDLGDLRYENDLATRSRLFERYLGRPVVVTAGGRDVSGTLLASPNASNGLDEAASLVLRVPNAGVRSFMDPGQITSVDFPDADDAAFLEPTLLWTARSDREGLQNIRLNYLVAGLSWKASHELVLGTDEDTAQFSSRVGLRNDTGGRFSDARVRLLATERAENAGTPQRFGYGRSEILPDARAAVLNTTGSYELAQPATLADGQTRFYSMANVAGLAVTRFYVFDGVRFDRFQRNRQTDWNYGTEFDPTVDQHVAFQLPAASKSLPGGAIRVYQRKPDGSLDYLGQDLLAAPDENGRCTARIGPARGITGERERTAYSEIRPQHEYAETFEIRLNNLSDAPAEIRVVEHLYRSADFEILKADTEYITTSPQTIEFRPELKPAGKRTIHYTVRYRW